MISTRKDIYHYSIGGRLAKEAAKNKNINDRLHHLVLTGLKVKKSHVNFINWEYLMRHILLILNV